MHTLAETEQCHRVRFGKTLLDLVDVTHQSGHRLRFEVFSDLLRIDGGGEGGVCS